MLVLFSENYETLCFHSTISMSGASVGREGQSVPDLIAHVWTTLCPTTGVVSHPRPSLQPQPTEGGLYLFHEFGKEGGGSASHFSPPLSVCCPRRMASFLTPPLVLCVRVQAPARWACACPRPALPVTR